MTEVDRNTAAAPTHRLPVRYLDHGLVLTETTAWGYVRLLRTMGDLMTTADHERETHEVAAALADLPSGEIHLLAVPRRTHPARWAERRRAAVTRPGPGFAEHLRATTAHLQRLGCWTSEIYLGVALGRRRTGPTTLAPLRLLRTAERALGLEDHAIAGEEIAYWRALAVDLGERVAVGALVGRCATTEELQWLIKRSFHRGLPVPPVSPRHRSEWGAGEVTELGDRTLHTDASGRFLHLRQPSGASWMAFLSLARLTEDPAVLAEPQWLQAAAAPGRPLEISARLRLHTGGSELAGGIRFAVHGPDHGVTLDRVKQVMGSSGRLGIGLEWPVDEQLTLFCEAVPGDGARADPSPLPGLTLEALARGLPAATPPLGDRDGPYLGTGTRRQCVPVTYDPLGALPQGRPATVITGGDGEGGIVSHLTAELVHAGVWLVVLDPSGRFPRSSLPGNGPAGLVPLATAEDGTLDPFMLGRTPAAGAALAADVLGLLLPPELSAARDTAVLTACAGEAAAERPSLDGVIDRLRALGARGDGDAGQAAEALAVISGQQGARLCFAAGDRGRMELSTAAVLVTLHGLALPAPDTGAGTGPGADRLALAILLLAGELARCLAEHQVSLRPKAILLTESWRFTATRRGRGLVARLANLGRERNAALLLADARPQDLADEPVRDTIAALLVHRCADEPEAAEALHLAGLPDAPEHRRTLLTLTDGEFLFRDPAGHTGLLTGPSAD